MTRPDGPAPARRPIPPALQPLADPRALLGSATFHVALLLVSLGLAALGVGLASRSVEPARVLHAELGPVDNRAPAEAGGGAPGDLAGDGRVPTVRLEAEAEPPAPPSPIVVIEPAPAPTPDAQPDARTAGLGPADAPGAAPGGGGGSGGGQGGGVGRGVGAATEFFGARERAGSFAYVIDVSGSMIDHDALGLARRELLASLDALPDDARVAVILYNRTPTVLADADGRTGLMPATPANRAALRDRIAATPADGSTRPVPALDEALALGPEVVYLLTDGQELTFDDVTRLQARLGGTRVHAVEFGGGLVPVAKLRAGDSPLRQLARASRGSFRRVDVRGFLTPPRP